MMAITTKSSIKVKPRRDGDKLVHGSLWTSQNGQRFLSLTRPSPWGENRLPRLDQPNTPGLSKRRLCRSLS